MKRCPECGSPLEGLNGKHYYSCIDEDCPVYSVKFTNRGKVLKVKRIIRVGITSLAEEIGFHAIK